MGKEDKMARSITVIPASQLIEWWQDTAENEKPSGGGILQGFYRSGRTVE